MPKYIKFEIKYMLSSWINIGILIFFAIGITLSYSLNFINDNQLILEDLNRIAFTIASILYFFIYVIPFIKNNQSHGKHFNKLTQIIPLNSRCITIGRYAVILFFAMAFSLLPLISYGIINPFSHINLPFSTLVDIFVATMNPFVFLGSIYMFIYFCLPRYDLLSMIIYFPSVLLPISLSRLGNESIIFVFTGQSLVTIIVFSVSLILSLIFTPSKNERLMFN